MNRLYFNNQNGFTLLELIVSLSLLSIIMVIILGGLRLSITSWNAGERELYSNQVIRIAVNRMKEDIGSMVSYHYKKSDIDYVDRLAFRGDSRFFRFVSAAEGINPSLKQYGLREVTYLFTESGDNPNWKNLVLRETFLHPDMPVQLNDSANEYTLIENVSGYKIKYFIVIYNFKDEIEFSGWVDSFIGDRDKSLEENRKRYYIKSIKIGISFMEETKTGLRENIIPELIFQIYSGNFIS